MEIFIVYVLSSLIEASLIVSNSGASLTGKSVIINDSESIYSPSLTLIEIGIYVISKTLPQIVSPNAGATTQGADRIPKIMLYCNFGRI